MSIDRFIMPINPVVYSLRGSQGSEPKVETKPSTEYRDDLCKAMFGVTMSKMHSMSMFSPPIVCKASPFDPYTRYEQSPPVRVLKLSSAEPEKVLAAPSIGHTSGQPSRLIAPLGNDSFMVACAQGVYRVAFSENCSYTAENLYETSTIPEVSHITIIDPDTSSIVVANTRGHLYHILGNGHRRVIQREEALNPITDLFTIDPSTFVFGSRDGDLSIADLRSKHLTPISLSRSPTCLALLPKTRYIAAGFEKAIGIFDLRSSRTPAWIKQTETPATAISWHVGKSSTTFLTALGGTTPTLVAHSMEQGASSLCVTKTQGIVHSVLCSKNEDTIITPHETAAGKCIALWKYSQSPRPNFFQTSSGSFPEGTNPSCGALEKNDHSIFVTFPQEDSFAYWKLISPPPNTSETSTYSFEGFSPSIR